MVAQAAWLLATLFNRAAHERGDRGSLLECLDAECFMERFGEPERKGVGCHVVVFLFVVG